MRPRSTRRAALRMVEGQPKPRVTRAWFAGRAGTKSRVPNNKRVRPSSSLDARRSSRQQSPGHLAACLITTLTGAMLAGGDTSAQQPSLPKDDRITQARQHFTEGAAAFTAGNYDEAVAHFMSAYDLDPRGPLLLNIAQALRLKTPPDCAGAHRYYELFLASEPHAPERNEVLKHMSTMQACMATERQARTQPEQVIAEPAASPVVAREPPARSSNAAAWLTTGGGLLTLTGAVLYTRVRIRYAELRESCPCSDALVDRWQRLSHVSYTLLGAGFLSTLAGIFLWTRAPAVAAPASPGEHRGGPPSPHSPTIALGVSAREFVLTLGGHY